MAYFADMGGGTRAQREAGIDVELFNWRGVYYAAIPLNGGDGRGATREDNERAQLEAYLLNNLFTSFEREQIVIQAGVQDFGTAGPNAGYAAWPVHGEQWTLTIPPPELAPANLDLDLAHISDVILRLHHRAGTVAPAGQGTFTPSCG